MKLAFTLLVAISPHFYAEDLLVDSAALKPCNNSSNITLYIDGKCLPGKRSLKNSLIDFGLGPLSKIQVERGLITYSLSYEEVGVLSENSFLLLPGDQVKIQRKIRRQ